MHRVMSPGVFQRTLTTPPSPMVQYRFSFSVAAMSDGVSATPGIGAPKLTVGLIAGGINTNVVPDRVTFRLDRRMIPEENPEQVDTALRALIEEAASGREGITVHVERVMLAAPLTPVGDVVLQTGYAGL